MGGIKEWEEPSNPPLAKCSQNFLGLLVCIGCISLVPTKLVDFLCKLLQTKVKQVVQGEEEKYQDTDKIMILEISKEIKKGKNISHYKSIFIGVLEN